MKDILLNRNDLKNKSIHMRSMRFEPNISSTQIDKVAEEQHAIYEQWNFYDKFIKAREEVKHEIKPNHVGKTEQFNSKRSCKKVRN